MDNFQKNGKSNTHNSPRTRSAPKNGAKQNKVNGAKKKDEKKSKFIKTPAVTVTRSAIDRPMMIIIFLLTAFGTVMVFSSSFASAYTQKGDSMYYIKKQILFLSLGLVCLLVSANFINYRLLRHFTPHIFIVSVALLIIVLVLGVSRGVARRWIYLGPISIQPSEIMKLALVLLLAHYFAIYQDRVTNYRNFWESSKWGIFVPYGITVGVLLLVALEKHFSGVIIIALIATVVIVAAGARPFWFFVVGGGGSVLLLAVILLTDYAKERIDLWLHPENYEITGKIWQTVQGLNAIGSGGLLGVGLGNSYQKYNYVSEPQNDFIFSIICEELGFVGALAVIALFVLFIWRGLVIALKAPDTYSSLVAIGIVAHVGIQAVLNIAVVTATIPNTGITLPFFSYGGTSTLLLMTEMGILLSISRYSYHDKL